MFVFPGPAVAVRGKETVAASASCSSRWRCPGLGLALLLICSGRRGDDQGTESLGFVALKSAYLH